MQVVVASAQQASTGAGAGAAEATGEGDAKEAFRSDASPAWQDGVRGCYRSSSFLTKRK
jgi:hypothetical protein